MTDKKETKMKTLSYKSIKEDENKFKVIYDVSNKDKPVFHIPLSFSVLFKKILWADPNIAVKMFITTISRVSMLGLNEYFDLKDPDTIELLNDIEEVNFRVNDENIDDIYHRDAFSTLDY